MTFRFAIAIFFALYFSSLTKKIAIAKRLGTNGAGKSLITDIMSKQVSLWEGRKVIFGCQLFSRSVAACRAIFVYFFVIVERQFAKLHLSLS